MRTLAALLLAFVALIVLFGTGSVVAEARGFAAYAPAGFGVIVALLVIISGWLAVRLLPKEEGVTHVVEGAAWLVLLGAIALNGALFATSTATAPAFARASADVIKASAVRASSAAMGPKASPAADSQDWPDRAAPTSSTRIHAAPPVGPRSRYCGDVDKIWNAMKGAHSALPVTCESSRPGCFTVVVPDELDAAIRTMPDPLARFFACLGGDHRAANFITDPLFAPRAAVFRDIGGHVTDGYDEVVRAAGSRVAADHALFFGPGEPSGTAAHELAQRLTDAHLSSPDRFFGELWVLTHATPERNCTLAEEAANQLPRVLMDLRATLKSKGTVFGYDALVHHLEGKVISFDSTTRVVDERVVSLIGQARQAMDRADFLRRINAIQLEIGPDFVDVKGQGALKGGNSRVDRVTTTRSGYAACSSTYRPDFHKAAPNSTLDYSDPKLTPMPIEW
jgi:hypothetical protein